MSEGARATRRRCSAVGAATNIADADDHDWFKQGSFLCAKHAQPARALNYRHVRYFHSRKWAVSANKGYAHIMFDGCNGLWEATVAPLLMLIKGRYELVDAKILTAKGWQYQPLYTARASRRYI